MRFETTGATFHRISSLFSTPTARIYFPFLRFVFWPAVLVSGCHTRMGGLSPLLPFTSLPLDDVDFPGVANDLTSIFTSPRSD